MLYTGYLEKKNPVSGSYKKRFVVLTQTSLHWFRRDDGNDLFGEERGNVSLNNILTTRILDEDSTAIEIQTTDTKKRYFKATSNAICEEWVSAIRSACKTNTKRPGLQRRATISGIRNPIMDDVDDADNDNDVTVLLVSQKSTSSQTEIVIARNPEFGRIITLASIKKQDEIIISMSNGGFVSLSYNLLVTKGEDGNEFDLALQQVPLASSLKLSVLHFSIESQQGTLDISLESNKFEDKKKNKKIRDYVLDFAMAITSDRGLAINIVLSLMVLMAGTSSLRAIGPDALLLFMFAITLSVVNIYQIILRTRKDENLGQQTVYAFRLIVHGHNFTSPDAPIIDIDNEIPQRFIDGCDGDLKEARRRWDITRHWRETEGVNTILEERQPYFNLIKTMYPHYHCGRGKSGHPVFYERPGEFESTQLAARGVVTEHLLRHWLFTTEYQWKILCNNDEKAKSIAVIDIANIKMTDLAGESLNFLKKSISIANQHYPERSFAILIVNAPVFFSMIWRLVKPLVHENTQKKIKILSTKQTLEGLMELIDIEQIPVYYGGKLDFGGKDSCRFQSAESLALQEYVRALNEKFETGTSPTGATTTKPFSASVSNHDIHDADDLEPDGNLPPGNPGDLPPPRPGN